MNIFEQVIVLTRKLEGILENEFQADGRGLHEKTSSVENHLPDSLEKKLRYIATIRNKLMHEDGFVVSQPEVFISTVEQAINELQILAENKTQQSHGHAFLNTPLKSSSSSSTKYFVIMAIIAAIVLTLGAFSLYSLAQNILDPIKDRNARAAEAAKTQRLEKHKKYLEYRESIQKQKPRYKSARLQNSSIKNSTSPNNTAPKVSSADNYKSTSPNNAAPKVSSADKNKSTSVNFSSKKVQPNSHYSIENDALSITDIKFSFKRGSFNKTEPSITVTAKNTTTEYISSAQLHARLYIPSKKDPAVDTLSGSRPKTLSLFFGDYGLKPGESVTKNIYLSGHSERAWSTPNILNANKHLLILDVISFYDGMNQKKPAHSKGFSSINLSNTLNSKPENLAKPTVNLPNIGRLKTLLDQGKSVGIGNDKLEITSTSISYERGSFNRMEPKLTITVRNQSTLTFSHAKLHAQLYTNGGSQPILRTKKPFYLFFDERGLAPNATITKKISLSGLDYRDWTAPDILNANRKQVMIKINSINDGFNNTISNSSSEYF